MKVLLNGIKNNLFKCKVNFKKALIKIIVIKKMKEKKMFLIIKNLLLKENLKLKLLEKLSIILALFSKEIWLLIL
jgi:hypothetical protein